LTINVSWHTMSYNDSNCPDVWRQCRCQTMPNDAVRLQVHMHKQIQKTALLET